MEHRIYRLIAVGILAAFGFAGRDVSWANAAEARVERIRNTVREITEEAKPVDIERLIVDIGDIPNDLDAEARTVVMAQLARMLLYDGEIRYEPVPRTGLDPQDILRSAIIQVFAKLGTKNDVVALQKFYEIHGDRGHSELPALIIKLGGVVPERAKDVGAPSGRESVPSMSAEEKNSRRLEVQSLLQGIASNQMSNEKLARAIARIGEIGKSQDAVPIIEKLRQTNVHWIVRQDALAALSKLGGTEAREYLIKELQKPMPKDANLEDYDDIQAILRSQAALALVSCGDADAVSVLEQFAADEKQFKRVRESCAKAATRIRDRSQSQTK